MIKRFTYIIALFAAILVSAQGFAQDTDIKFAGSDFSGGEGTLASPYLISNVDDLAQLDKWATAQKTAGKYFKLTNDIETPFKGMIASEGVFEGIFDGDNHCVTVEANFPELNYVGFIGFILFRINKKKKFTSQ